MTEMTTAEIANGNHLVAQCERLINARSRCTGTRAVYADTSFEVTYTWQGMSRQLQVQHRDVTVLRGAWSGKSDPGYAHIEPGPWQADFLSLRAAHA